MSKSVFVSAGEVCSIDIAKKYGFFDKKNYYTDEYSDVRTFTPIDQQENRDSNEVCKQTSDGKVAYPSCTLVYGVPYEQKPTDRSKCVINMGMFCPSKLQKGDRCKRSNILPPPPIAMKSRCDEKPTDWYMIPNYHLGNGYAFVEAGNNTRCMTPCSTDRMPGFTTDPVDGASAGVLTNTDPNQCYLKAEYMGGKYDGTNNFCPISWVHRLGLKEEDIVDDIVKRIQKYDTSNTYSKIATTTASKEAKDVLRDGKKLLENVDFPNSQMMAACSKLNTPERVAKAYSICKAIHENPNSINTILQDKTQQKVLKKACHVLFCNEEDDLVSTINLGADPLCFQDTEVATDKEIIDNDKNIQLDSVDDVDIGPPPQINEPAGLDRGTRIVVIVAVIALLLVIVGSLSPFIWKLLVYIYENLLRPAWKYVWKHIKCSSILYAIKGALPGNTFANAGTQRKLCLAATSQVQPVAAVRA